MLMTNENIRFYPHDRLFAATILRIIPYGIKPNHVTILRFLLIPFVLYFLWKENWPWALGCFLIAALTDAVDGSLARVRKQITHWGTVADPIADKLLIATVVILFVAREVNVTFALISVLMEALIVLGASLRGASRGSLISANGYGKLKMLFQVIGVTLLLFAELLGFLLAVPFAIGTLTIAIVFAIVSLLTYGF